MRLLSLSLKNIRSYKQATIHFPQGIVLLAGDIGSGKSTLLLAIEFALFGLRRGEAQALLRHGCPQGKVSLTILVAGEEVTITRTLKKTAHGVSQDAGSLTRKGVKEDLTTLELKSRVLSLLNYPDSLLTQNKSLVFRYTVYTPQEEMKHILYDKAEERLDTLRKLFALDKYKVARENTTLLSREVKQRAERLLGQADDLPKILDQQKKSEEEQKTIQQDYVLLEEAVRKAREEREAQTKKLESYEDAWREREKKVREQEKMFLLLRQKKDSEEQLKKEVYALEQAIKDLPNTNEEELKKLREEQQITRQTISSLEEKIRENNNNLAKLDAKLEELTKNHDSITGLTTCPTCKQTVTADHKSHVEAETTKKVFIVDERRELIRQAKDSLEQQLREQKVVYEEVQKKIETTLQEVTRAQQKIRYEEQLREKRARLEVIKEEQRVLAQKEQELQEELIQETFDKKTLASLREQARTAEGVYQEKNTQKARLEERIRQNEAFLATIQGSIKEKERAQKYARAHTEQHAWLNKQFSNALFTIEKHVLLTIYHQFNDAFKQYFDTLIEDEAITVRLEHDFSPLIEQNGYEILVEHLSGGEKTSVALAYRLALNHVINQALENLRTDGLLILDEPTDGFSSEQLDRVQELLTKLSLEQIVLVSHEPKMESFVDHVIRIHKQEHESSILE